MPWSAIMVTRKLCSMFAKYLTASVSAVTFPVQPGEPVIPCRRLHMRWHAILALILVASRSSVLRMEKSMCKYRYNICQSMHANLMPGLSWLVGVAALAMYGDAHLLSCSVRQMC